MLRSKLLRHLVWFVLLSFPAFAEINATVSASCTAVISYLLSDNAPTDVPYTPPTDSIEWTTIETTDGEAIRVDRVPGGMVFENAEGKPVLLELFGYTCPHCINSIPAMNSLQAAYGNDVVIIAIETYGLSNDGLIAFKNDQGITYSVVSKEKSGQIVDFVIRLTGGFPGVPYTMLFDANGQIVNNPPHLGDIDAAYFSDLIDAELQNQAGTATQ